MTGRMFRIPSTSLDVGFIDACAAHLTPKMALSQVRPSGSSLRHVVIEPTPTRALTQRPSASTYREDDRIAEMNTDLVVPMFQPLRGQTGSLWCAIEYGITTANSSLISADSTAEREDTDEEIMSFDLGPELFDPLAPDRIPSDEFLDDLQQGLVPGGSEPRVINYDLATDEMPVRPSILATMRHDMEIASNAQEDTPMSPESAPDPVIGFSYDYTRDAPPTIQKIAETATHSSPYKDAPKIRARAVPASLARHPRSTSVPPASKTVAKMAKRYMPSTEVTPPISPVRAEAPSAAPSPIQHTGRGRGRGRWRAQSTETPGVGTRSKTRKAEAAATQAMATRALWPEMPDRSLQITRMAHDLSLQDPPEDRYRYTQSTVPAFMIDEKRNEVRPPAAGIHSHHQDVFVIPPPRTGGGAAGASAPVSTAPLGLIQHFDPLLATQLREDPDSLSVRDTRLRVLATIRQVRTGLVGQLAALQQWEEAMHSQGGQ